MKTLKKNIIVGLVLTMFMLVATAGLASAEKASPVPLRKKATIVCSMPLTASTFLRAAT